MIKKERHSQQVYYVSPAGNDSNPGTKNKPFQTIEKARDVIRTINKNMTGDILVFLRGGTYTIDRTIVFDAEDSGTNGYNIVYSKYREEKVTISGGKKVSGWHPDVNGRWKTNVDLNNFRQLYVNDIRVNRTRRELTSELELQDIYGYRTCNSQLFKLHNQSDIEFCYCNPWCHTRCKLDNIDKSIVKSYYDVWMWKPYFFLARTKCGNRVEYPSHMENSFEFLNNPGEWYFDRVSHTLYYIPKCGEDIETAEVIAPAVERLIELKGTLGNPVRNIQFEGITFAHATWLEPSENGFIDVQANFRVTPDLKFFIRNVVDVVYGEFTKSPSNIVCHAAKSIRFERCSFTKLGSGGLDMEYGSQDNIVSGCKFYDISGTAIQVGDVLRNDHHPEDMRMVVKNNKITNNYIHDVCVEYKGGVGIFVGYTDGTVIAHNEISNLPYSGISVGWGWGETDEGGGAHDQPFSYDTPTIAKNNRIEYNHIHHVMQELCDGGGIYTLGNLPGTVIQGNHIHNNTQWHGGIYLDEGSGYIDVVGNIVYNVVKPMNYNNLPQNRNETCKEHNNYFAVKLSPSCKKIIDKAGLQPEYKDLLTK